MLFTDSIFLFYFLPFSLLAHRLTLRNSGSEYPNAARLTVFLLTLCFYGFKEPWWLLPFLICIVFDFIWSRLLHREGRQSRRKAWLLCSVVQNIGMLAVFKYWSFCLETLRYFFPDLSVAIPSVTNEGRSLGLPPGISFYTFESLSYVIDVYRGRVVPPKRLLEFLSFIAMFPRFIAGPIVRYGQMVQQFHSYRGMQLEPGLFLFTLGLFLKTCFADNFAIFARYAFDKPESEGLDCIASWVGIYCYSMQIYFDFSGYSLMAIGLGRCFGFHFPTNFNRPYHSVTIQEFWQRWHISLSTWLKDYLYIPMGGNRHGTIRTSANLFLTMVIGGLWHGSSWTFALWGAWHGMWLVFERTTKFRSLLPSSVNSALTFIIVMVGWVFFRAESGIKEAVTIISQMADVASIGAFNPEALYLHPLSLFFCGVGSLWCFGIERWIDPVSTERTIDLSWSHRFAASTMLACSLLLVFSERSIPFIYFRF